MSNIDHFLGTMIILDFQNRAVSGKLNQIQNAFGFVLRKHFSIEIWYFYKEFCCRRQKKINFLFMRFFTWRWSRERLCGIALHHRRLTKGCVETYYVRIRLRITYVRNVRTIPSGYILATGCGGLDQKNVKTGKEQNRLSFY